MTDMPLRDSLLATTRSDLVGPGVGALQAEFAAATRRRFGRAVARFQWFALALYTVPAADAWLSGGGFGANQGLTAGWLLLALLAIFGPAIAVRRAARRPLPDQIRQAGRIEALAVVLLVVAVSLAAVVWLPRGAGIALPTSWAIVACAVTVPVLTLVLHRVSGAWARRFDPEWWD